MRRIAATALAAARAATRESVTSDRFSQRVAAAAAAVDGTMLFSSLASAVVFHNGDAEYALDSLPPCKLNDALAVSFCVDLPSAEAQPRSAVSRSAARDKPCAPQRCGRDQSPTSCRVVSK